MTEAHNHPAQNAMYAVNPQLARIAFKAKPSAMSAMVTSIFAAKIMPEIIPHSPEAA
jgi:hypothetical protein